MKCIFQHNSVISYPIHFLFRATAGKIFEQYYVTHAGLGVWDTTDDYKFTIEFVSSDYVGALLPTVSGNKLVWENEGKIVFTAPTDYSDWLSSQLISVSTGQAYNQLVTFLENQESDFKAFQPVEVVYYNASETHPSNYTYSSYELYESGNLLVEKRESFWFVNRLIYELNTFGVDVKAYLPFFGTSFQYLSAAKKEPKVIEWSTGGAADPDVLQWYQDLTTCYNTQFNIAEAGSLGGEYLLQSLQQCYSTKGYVYRTQNSVYDVRNIPSNKFFLYVLSSCFPHTLLPPMFLYLQYFVRFYSPRTTAFWEGNTGQL
jgi:hypothetical protein